MTDHEKLKEAVKDQFSRNAEKYVTSETHARGNDLAVLTEWLNPQADWTVLDVATGGGHVTKQLSPYVGQVISTDFTRAMLVAARNHVMKECNNVSFVVADAENLPFLDNYFDVVTCRIAAHHFPNPNKFINESARVAKENGYVLLIDNIVPADDELDGFVNQLEKLRDESHVRCHRIEEWTEWAQAAGLEVVKSTLRKKKFDFPTWVRRTTKSEEQVGQVESHIINASKEMQEYCGLLMQDGKIVSIHIDEWMVLLKKAPKE
jgi:ubiquinone/menaquinone biosynthesis C-methylase UbiE